MSENIITINENGSLNVPDNPVIPYIQGDGIGPDIWKASSLVFNQAIETSYKGEKKITFKKVFAGQESFDKTKQWLPKKSIEQLKKYKVSIKGPLTTPVGHGMRSLNVAIRQELDLFACIRPVKYIKGVPSPCNKPEKIDMVIFRENTEDIYLGIEWEKGKSKTKQVIDFINEQSQKKIDRKNTGIGVKPISEKNSKRLIKKAIQYAIDNNRKNITLMHKGNIMKFTEGAFMKWGYEVAKDEFKDFVISEKDLWDKYDGQIPKDKIIIKDRIADNMFQQVLLKPNEYDIIATCNLNGDYISDLLAAMIGGLGVAPGANIGKDCAVFEATHGTAPLYANLDKINPSSLILSGAMMLEHMGWHKASELIHMALQKTILDKKVTYDLASQIPNSTELKCSEFAKAICSFMKKD